MTQAAEPLSGCGGAVGAGGGDDAVFGDVGVGVVMMRVVKLVPAVENPPVVMPAPKISALAVVVVTVPLLADVPVPEAEAPTSNGFTGSRPLYSRARTSTKGVARIEGCGHGVGSGGGALMFGA